MLVAVIDSQKNESKEISADTPEQAIEHLHGCKVVLASAACHTFSTSCSERAGYQYWHPEDEAVKLNKAFEQSLNN